VNSNTPKTTSILVLLPLLLATIFLTAFINNSIAVYGQNITNSNNNASQNQNQTQNNPNSTTTIINTPDKSDKEIRNEKIVRDFYNNVFFAKNASAAVNYLEQDYIQHNPNVPTGREAFINAFTQIFKQNPNFSTQIKKIYTDGDYVIVHSFSPIGLSGRAIVDIYRINNNDGKIAEHWDVIQQIPSKSANNNTIFYLH
jgi:predicted SnoaL-like aldol condensation-catalyzing enzyme